LVFDKGSLAHENDASANEVKEEKFIQTKEFVLLRDRRSTDTFCDKWWPWG